MTRSRLPLRGIGVFEAVARLGSFKAAAAELHLTPSAVSHQLRALQAELGVELFTRSKNGTALSAVTVDYASLIIELLERLRSGTDELVARGRANSGAALVRIRTPPSLATHWLMPRLPAFLDANLGIDVRVFAARTADGNANDFDVVIGYGDASRCCGRALPLLKEVIQPYCAPSRLGGDSSLDAADLLLHPLIRSQENALSWKQWFAQRHVHFNAAIMKLLQIDPSYVAIEAAVKGMGIVLESSILTRDHVEAGRLVASVQDGGRPSVSYWLSPARPGTSQATALAHKWLISQGNCH